MYVDRNVVKIITGVRRCGKTTLMKQFIEELKENGVPEEHIFYVNLEGIVYAYFSGSSDLRDMLISFIDSIGENHCYIFLDEVQCVEGWAEVAAEMLNLFDCDIYVSSSNSSIFSGDYARKLDYRYVRIDMYPLTFSEYLVLTADEPGHGSLQASASADQGYDNAAAAGSTAAADNADNTQIYGYPDDENAAAQSVYADTAESSAYSVHPMTREELFRDYLRRGCMPGAYAMPDDAAREDYLRGIYSTIMLKDVVQCNRLRDVSHLDRIMEFVLSHIGETFSPKALKDHVRSLGITISVDTVYSFLDALAGSFLIYRIPRYDIRAGRELETHEKYYVCDIAMRNAVMCDEGLENAAAIESALCLEMLTRGFKLYVGKQNQSQIDFMAVKGEDRTYLNCCETVDDKDVAKKKFGNLSRIRDNYFKLVLSMDTETKINKGGIINYPITEFLSQG